jgi:hypothetical protein
MHPTLGVDVGAGPADRMASKQSLLGMTAEIEKASERNLNHKKRSCQISSRVVVFFSRTQSFHRSG